ncbi:hypothetical protein [Hydrogenophaga sp.]|uniref:hypothetical protein n=1 Tax=Hydrogenophaga sp. TaxID=1904254 RepID=UPI0025B9C23A|nr:hypothetical protein [Hydrogenophaga sp.]
MVFLEEQIGSRNSVGEAAVHIERQARKLSLPTFASLAVALDLSLEALLTAPHSEAGP